MKRKNFKMMWAYPARGDVMSVLFVVFLLGLLAFCFVWFPNPQSNTGAGFGPDWDCIAVPTGEPICHKRLSR
jgi:hypothetical protein